MKLSLFYPAKPFITTQAWGIKNPSYEQFGFSRHNGYDFLLGDDNLLYAPCDFTVYETGEIPSGAGIYIKGITDDIEAEGATCYVHLVFMHLKEIKVVKGQKIIAGDILAVADNTGFSTGPHTHMTTYRTDRAGNRLDLSTTQREANMTFDPFPYFNGFYAVDAQKVGSLLKTIIGLYEKLIGVLKR